MVETGKMKLQTPISCSTTLWGLSRLLAGTLHLGAVALCERRATKRWAISDEMTEYEASTTKSRNGSRLVSVDAITLIYALLL